MKVLLRRDVDGVGRRGDVVDVSGGYARNFLLPSGAALLATDTMASQAASMRRARDLRDAKDQEAALAQKDALERQAVRIPARASAQGKLFGSVGPLEVANAVSAATGVTLERSQVVLEEHLKELGSTQVEVKLFGDVRATVTVEVVAAA